MSRVAAAHEDGAALALCADGVGLWTPWVAAGQVVVGGSVLGISSTAVTPPSTAAAVPEARSSLCGKPGSRKWTCASMMPGSTCRPVASITSAAWASAPSAPIAAIRPSRMPTSATIGPPGVHSVPPLITR